MNADQRDIAELIVRKAIENGLRVAVSDGTTDDFNPTLLRANVINGLGKRDEDFLTFYRDKERVGWIVLQYSQGNELIQDASESLEVRALLGGEEVEA